MKIWVILILLFSALTVHAQDWKKSCTLKSGEVIHSGDSIKINYVGSLKVLQCIRPRPQYDALSKSIYMRHLGAFMIGNTYKLVELSRIIEDEKDILLGIIEDEWADPSLKKVYFMVHLERAIENGVITVIKSDTK